MASGIFCLVCPLLKSTYLNTYTAFVYFLTQKVLANLAFSHVMTRVELSDSSIAVERRVVKRIS